MAPTPLDQQSKNANGLVHPSGSTELNMDKVKKKLELLSRKASFPRLPDVRHVQSSVVWHAISGTIGSVIAESVLFPVDTVKLHVQTAAADDSKGFFATALRVVQQRGLSGLYGGLGGAMIKETVHSMNFWLFHGFLFRCIAKNHDTSKTHPTMRLFINLVAKQLNWLCTVPFEAISTVNQLSKTSPGFFPTAISLYKTGGVGIFYRGLPVSLLLAINPAIMNTLITSFLRTLALFRQAAGMDYYEARNHGASSVGAATALAKVVATILTYPLIRAKVILQTSSEPTSLVVVLRNVLASEGVAGLYRGVIAMSYKTVLWNSLMMAVKHLLSPIQSVSPPATPEPVTPDSKRMPLLGREPFPVELVTVEKLNEILIHLKMKDSISNQKRIDDLEDGLKAATREMREVKSLIVELVAATMQNAQRTTNFHDERQDDLMNRNDMVQGRP